MMEVSLYCAAVGFALGFGIALITRIFRKRGAKIPYTIPKESIKEYVDRHGV